MSGSFHSLHPYTPRGSWNPTTALAFNFGEAEEDRNAARR
jgi:hypothetical protein